MKPILITAVGLAMLGLAGLAQAAETTGKIAAIQGNILVLEDGSQFTLSQDATVETMQPGTPVVVSYEERDGKMIATEVKSAE